MVFLATIYHAVIYRATGTLLSQSPTTFILRTLYFDGAIYYLVGLFALITADLISVKIVLTIRIVVIILVSYSRHSVIVFDRCL